MPALLLEPLVLPIQKTVELPGSLSYTIRALLLAAMTSGEVTIVNPAKCDDSYAMVAILQALGIKVVEGKNCFVVAGSVEDVQDKEYFVDVKLSGRTARSILPFLAAIPGVKTVVCQEAFKRRPIHDLVVSLRSLGATICYLEEEGKLPVKIGSCHLHPGIVHMTGEVSSQYFSALMMVAPFVGALTLEVEGTLTSKPFIDVTIDTLKNFGIHVENDAYKRFFIKGGQRVLNPGVYTVEADAIHASYFWAIAAVTKSSVRVSNLGRHSKQGDVRFVDILEAMNCKVTKEENWIEVEGCDALQAVSVDMNALPDSAVTLAVLASFAKGTTTISGLKTLSVKESDRIRMPQQELMKMGVQVAATVDSLTITGGEPCSAMIETHGDHRIAMAFAVAGAKLSGMEINDPEVVTKSFPHFWQELERLSMGVVKR